MCGIVGLHITNRALQPRLGALLTTMLDCMTTRGPDSAGIALYADPDSGGALRYSVIGELSVRWPELGTRLAERLGARVAVQTRGATAAVLVTAAGEQSVRSALAETAPDVVLVGWGEAMEIYKDVGAPAAICERYGIPSRAGYQGIGHTRMATESAVTTDHSHPFAPAADLALVHNGSFSNYASVRRRLEDDGIVCTTDNDSEVCARFVAQQTSRGAALGDALRMVLKTMDGFFTLLVATRDQFAVVRDSFACKPVVIAEAPDYVAVGSEYHALAGLPGIGQATVFEPGPEEISLWSR